MSSSPICAEMATDAHGVGDQRAGVVGWGENTAKWRSTSDYMTCIFLACFARTPSRVSDASAAKVLPAQTPSGASTSSAFLFWLATPLPFPRRLLWACTLCWACFAFSASSAFAIISAVARASARRPGMRAGSAGLGGAPMAV